MDPANLRVYNAYKLLSDYAHTSTTDLDDMVVRLAVKRLLGRTVAR